MNINNQCGSGGNRYPDPNNNRPRMSLAKKIGALAGFISTITGVVTAVEPVRNMIASHLPQHHTARSVNPCDLPADITLQGGPLVESYQSAYIAKSAGRLVISGKHGTIDLAKGVRVDELDVCGADIGIGFEGTVKTANLSIVTTNPANEVMYGASRIDALYLYGHTQAVDTELVGAQAVGSTHHVH